MPRRKLMLSCLFALILFSSQLCLGEDIFAQELSKEEEAFFVARKAYDDSFYEVSLELLERFVKNFPDSKKIPDAELLIGECYFHQSRYLEALAKFENILKQNYASDSKDAVYYWIAEVHFKGNNFAKAAEYYRRVSNEYPDSPYLSAALYSLGWCLFQEAKFSEALAVFKTVEERYPQEQQVQDASFKIVECLYNLKDYSGLKEKAKIYIKKYAKDRFRLAYLYFYLAEADYYLNNFNDAIEEYGKIVGISSDEKLKALANLGLGWSYLKLKRYKDAEGVFLDTNAEYLEKRSLDVLLLGRAILMADTNRINEAARIYDELLRKTQDQSISLQAYLGKADAFYNLAEYSQAINIYMEALEKFNPESIPQELGDRLHYGLSWAYLKQGEFKAAIKEFQKIAKTTEDRIVKVSALCQIGDTYQDSGEFKKAQETYDSILRDYPDSSYSDYVQYQLGLCLLKDSNYDGAILSFLALKRNFPNSKLLDDATYALGLSYFQRQDYQAAKQVLERFQSEVKASNLKSQAMYLLGTSLYNLGDFSGAAEVFKNIIRLYSQDIELVQKAEYEIADCFYQMGNEKEAMTRFKTLRSKYPDSSLTPQIIWWLGEYYYRHDDLELAHRYFSALIKDFPKSNLIANAYYAQGSIYNEEGRYLEAIENFQKVIEMGRADLSAQAAIVIADIYVKQDNPDLGLEAYKDILSKYPNLTGIIYPKIAGIYYNLGNYSQAVEFYRKGLDLVPIKQIASVQLRIAESLEAQGKTPDAIEEYLKVPYLYADSQALAVKALLRVGQIYEAKEEFKEAQDIYEKVISLNTEEAKYAQERIDWIKKNALPGNLRK
jgi:TolA-binding protein